MKKYSIELNENQLLALVESSDFESRVISGQLSEVLLRAVPITKNINRSKIRFLIDELKREMFPELDTNETYGIFHQKLDSKAKLLYDIHQVMRHTYSWSNNPEGGSTTWFQEPFLSCKEVPAIVKEIK